MSKFKKVTKASKNDGNKFTIRDTQLSVKGIFKNGDKLGVIFKGKGKTTYEVLLTASRNGTTFYGVCPRGLKMPRVGKPEFYELATKEVIFYKLNTVIEVN